jgi:hypothetical protein
VRFAGEYTHPLALWRAALGRCGVCGEAVPSPAEERLAKGRAPTVDHVFPRNPAAADLARIARLVALSPDRRRKVIAHAKCNRRKGNRAPTACELIFLMAVNARLRDRPEEVAARKRTAATKARRLRQRERRRLEQTEGALT